MEIFLARNSSPKKYYLDAEHRRVKWSDRSAVLAGRDTILIPSSSLLPRVEENGFAQSVLTKECLAWNVQVLASNCI